VGDANPGIAKRKKIRLLQKKNMYLTACAILSELHNNEACVGHFLL
jgi:hypothetical protein